MRNHEEIWTVESSRVWTIDPTPFRRFGYRELEESRVETLHQRSPEIHFEMRNSKCRNVKTPFWCRPWSLWSVVTSSKSCREELEETSSISEFRGDMENQETLHHRNAEILKCRNAKLNARSYEIQSNGAGEFKYDRRATVALQSVTARNH
jgi:hypothetical protein